MSHPITTRVMNMRRNHRTGSRAAILGWRMSRETAEALIAEHDTIPMTPEPETLFGAPITFVDSMPLGVVDLVPDDSTPYFPGSGTENKP